MFVLKHFYKYHDSAEVFTFLLNFFMERSGCMELVHDENKILLEIRMDNIPILIKKSCVNRSVYEVV